ncbi:MAG: hypothetical protein MHM6MM_004119 [Cercozoa sp. M6MM]
MADQQPQDLPRWLAALQPVLRNHGVGPAAIDVITSAFARQARFHREDVAEETRRLRENIEQRETALQQQLRAEKERHGEQVARLEAELAEARLRQNSVVNFVDEALEAGATNLHLDVKLRDREPDEESTEGSLQYQHCKIDVSDKQDVGEKRRAVLSQFSDREFQFCSFLHQVSHSGVCRCGSPRAQAPRDSTP